jgi:hypothetical protein
MKKDIKNIILVDGQKICRVTCPSERWYGKEIKDSETGLPTTKWFPSVTWIKSYWYMSPYLMKWIAEKGLTESDIIKKEAGLKGDKIHQATEDIDKGLPVEITATYLNKETGFLEELTADEYEAILSYKDYIDSEELELLANEMTVFGNGEEEYAGTLDRIFAKGSIKEDRQIIILDIKSSQSVYKDMILQLSAYSHADIDYKELGITEEEWTNRKLIILQVGYSRNKNGYKATEVSDRYDLFKLAYQTWKEENPDSKPYQRDLPMFIQSKFRAKSLPKVVEKPIKKSK